MTIAGPLSATTVIRLRSNGTSGRGVRMQNFVGKAEPPAAGPTAPTVTSGSASDVTSSSATLGGNITATGGENATERGIFYSTSNGFADGAGTKVSSAGDFSTGAYTVNVTGLSPNTIYYFKAFAANSGGTGYGAQASFTTEAEAATPAPALMAAGGATVDSAFNVTFVDDATWRAAISGITVDGSVLASGAYSVSSGQITFTPSQSTLLQTPGSKSIVVSATGYTDATVEQTIGVGEAAKLAITTQPTAPAANGGALAQQPVVVIRDQYNNLVSSSASVTAAVGAGTWTLGGTVTISASAGTATFLGLTASSEAAVTGATITFSSDGLTGATSSSFNIPAPNEIKLTAIGTVATEDFNTLASSGTSSTLPLGWYFTESGSGANSTYAAGTGSDNGGNTYSFGGSSSSERALGGLLTGSLVPSWGAKIKNSTGSTITALTISYIGETWRVGTVSRIDRIDFAYSTDASGINGGTWTDVNSLDYANPGQATGSGSLQHSSSITHTITGLNIASSSSIWIRWTDFDASSADDGMAIDDFSIKAVVAPSVTSGSATSIEATTATIADNNVTSDGGLTVTERGVAYGTSENPTVAGSKVSVAGTTGAFSADLSGLTAGTLYHVRAYAINPAGTTYGDNVSFTTKPGKPATPTADAVNTSGFTVNWSAVTGATKYRLDVATSGLFGEGTLVAGYNDKDVGGGASAEVTGLSPATTYYVRIRAENNAGAGENSDILTQATLGVPEISVESPAGSEIALGGSRASFGSVTVGSSADFTFRVRNTGSAALSVTAINFGGTHAADLSVQGSPSFPVSVAAAGQQDFTIRFSPGATGARSATVTFSNNDSDEGTYVINVSGTGTDAATAPVVTTQTPSPIGATSATLKGTLNSDGGESVDERGFVYSTTDSTPTIAEGATKLVSTTEGADFETNATGLAPSTLYYVRAYAENGVGVGYGAPVSFTTLKAEPVAAVSGFTNGTITTLNIPLTWTGVTADGYLILVSSSAITDPEDGTTVADDTDVFNGTGAINVAGGATSYSGFVDFVAGTVYNFKIYPYNNSGEYIDYRTTGAVNLQAEILPVAPSAAPVISPVTAVGFTASWNSIAGADQYRIDVATDSGFTSMVSGFNNLAVAGTSQVVTGLSANTEYFVQVRAENTAGAGANSTAASQTTSQLSAPTTLAASSITTTGFTANWNPVTGATGYRLDVYQYISGGDTTLFSADFTGFTGGGFHPNPSAGQLDSDFWKLTGWSYGSGSFGGTHTADDFARGASAGKVSTGGTYGFDVGGGNRALGVQPGGTGDFNPGAIVLRIQNTSGSTISGLEVSYKIYVMNDQGRANTFNFSHSSADVTYTNVSALDYTSPEAADSSPAWTLVTRSTTLSGLEIANNAYYYLRWNSADVSGSGSRDEFALDDVVVKAIEETKAYVSGYENLNVGDDTSYAVTGLDIGADYNYAVRATSANSTSADSDERAVSTLPPTPELFATAISGPMSGTYGNASGAESFTLSGIYLGGAASVNPPAGFQVSTRSDFASSTGVNGSPLSVGTAGTLNDTTIYVRILPTTAVGSPSGNIVISSSGAASTNVAVSGAVAQKALTITGISADSKVYDGTTTVNISGTEAYDGLVNSESFSVVGSPTWAFASASVGAGKTINQAGSYSAPSANYSISQPTLTADVTAKELTITGIDAEDKTYDGTTSVTISGTPAYSGLENGETFAVGGSVSWAFATAGVGVDKELVRTGEYDAPSANYTVTQPTLAATINPKGVTITGLSAGNKVYDGNESVTINGTAAYNGLVNDESFEVTDNVTWTFPGTAVGNNQSLVRSADFPAPSANYSITQPTLSANITAKALTITANSVNKAQGSTLTGGAGSTAFTSSGLVVGETIGSVTITYGSAAGATGDGNTPGVYPDQVTPSAATGGSFTASNYDITYVAGGITVTPLGAPLVDTGAADSITTDAANLSGEVTDENGSAVTARGFVYSASDDTPQIGEVGVVSIAASGSGAGSFSAGIDALSAGTLYYFQTYAVNASGTNYGGIATFTTLKTQPSGHAQSFRAGTTTTVNIPALWNAPGAAVDGFLLLVSSASITDPVDGTPLADDTDLSDGSGAINLAGNLVSYDSFTGFAAGTEYTFKIYTYNNSGSAIDYRTSSAPSFAAKLLPAAPASAPTFASVSATGFTVNWGAVTGADDYRMDVATDEAFTAMVSGFNDLTVNGISQVVTGLSANTMYYVRVRAANGGGSGANSPTGTRTTSGLSAPVALAATSVTDQGFTANWEAVVGATDYRLDVYEIGMAIPNTVDLIISEYIEGSSNNKYVEIYNGTGASVDLSDYEYRAFNNGASSLSASISLSGNLAHGATYLLANNQAVLAGVTVDVSSSAIGFNGDDAFAIYKKSTASYVDIFGRIGNDPGTSWTSADPSRTTVDKTLRRKSTVIAGVTNNPAGTGPTAFTTLGTEWEQYDLDTANDLGSHTISEVATPVILAGYENIDVGAVTSYQVNGLDESTAYQYVVRATSANSTSDDSEAIDVTTDGTCAAPTANLPTSSAGTELCSGGSVTLTASVSGGLAPFTYQWKKNGSVIEGATDSTYAIATLTTGDAGNYTVDVAATCDPENVSTSDALTLSVGQTPTVSIAVNPTACGTAESASLSFSVTGDPDQYSISFGASSAISDVALTSLSGTTVSIPLPGNLSPGNYAATLNVRDSASGCNASTAFNVVITTVPAQPVTITQGNPTGTVVCDGAQEVTYTIASVPNATSYTWTVPEGATILSGQGTTSITMDWGNAGGNVSVVANNNCGSSASRSLTISMDSNIPAVPVASATSDETTTSFRANWQAAERATGYKLDVSTSDSFTSGNVLTSFNVGNVTSYEVTNLNPGEEYHYRVRAYNACGDSDPSATIEAETIATTVTLAGWNVSGATSFGTSPYSASTVNANVTVVSGLTRGAGIGTGGTPALRGWGGTGWNSGNVADAVTANKIATAAMRANGGYLMSIASISKFDYRRSTTGPSVGVIQYSINGGAYVNIATNSYTSTSSSGASLPSISLTAIEALQNLSANDTVTFRIVNYGASSADGVWYIYDVSNSTADDFAISGTMQSLQNPTALSSTRTPPSTITVNWSKWLNRDVMIVRSTANSFTAPTGGQAYSVSDSIGSGTVVYKGSGTSFDDSGLTQGATYYYRVYTVDADYYSGGVTVSQNIPAAPSAPVAQLPLLVTTSSFRAAWSASAGATSYELDVAEDEAFTDMLPGYDGLDAGSETSYLVSSLSNDTTYYYRIRAVSLWGTSADSSTITVALPDTDRVQLVGPGGGSPRLPKGSSPGTAKLAFRGKAGTTYEVYFSDDEGVTWESAGVVQAGSGNGLGPKSLSTKNEGMITIMNNESGEDTEVEIDEEDSSKRYFRVVLAGQDPAASPSPIAAVVKPTIRAGYNLMAPPLQSDRRFDGDFGAELAEGRTAGGSHSSADQVMILENGSFGRTLYLHTSGEWREIGSGTESTYQLAPGQGFYLLSRSGTAGRFSGAVDDSGTNTVALGNSWNIVGPSQGKSARISDLQFDGTPAAATSITRGTYDKFVYEDANGNFVTVGRIRINNVDYWWDINNNTLSTNALAPGQGAYYLKTGGSGLGINF